MGSSRFNYILRCPVPIHISQITSHSVYFIHFIQFLTWHEWMDKWKPTRPKGSLEPFVYSSASVSKLKFGTNELLFFLSHNEPKPNCPLTFFLVYATHSIKPFLRLGPCQFIYFIRIFLYIFPVIYSWHELSESLLRRRKNTHTTIHI